MDKKKMSTIAVNTFSLFKLFYQNLMTFDSFEEFSGNTGLVRSHSELLLMLEDVKKCTMSEAARLLSFSKPYVTTLVDRLISENFIKRSSDLNDRRIIYIELTEHGKKYAKEHLKGIEDKLMNKFEVLPNEDLEELLKILPKMQEIISKLESIKIRK